MNILITGGLGYLGSQLAKKLLEQKNHVTIIDDARTHTLNEYDKARTELERNPNCLITIEDAMVCRHNLMHEIDLVYHLAATTGVKECENDIHGSKLNNIKLTRQIVARALENKVPRIVLASTAAVYGVAQKCTEKTETIPQNRYGTTKLLSELEIRQLNDTDPTFCGVIARLSNVYGKGYYTKNNVLTRFVKAALDGETLELYGNGKQVRDFVYIDDVVEALIKLGTHGKARGVYNVGSGISSSVRDIGKMIIKRTNKKSRLIHLPSARPEPQEGYKYSTKRLNGLRWKPHVTIKAGINLLINDLRDEDK